MVERAARSRALGEREPGLADVGLAVDDELRARLGEELAVSLRALRRQTRAYEEKRWSPGKLTTVSDALWRVSEGYLDVLDAQTS
ncbi:hypothetical protein F4560_004628 [Saccharothrix ecbatanensis]|uniref:DUF7711 domain-containing protein n=1 Tax=Saccharothrix ecbatanensis TaxID=1105145 RepID=A0A7W9HMG8_9PSEU|nr:hypothetical protein [Saccharothrix ecbatanensis]MBB5804860.1 hypothetical protein [Saccharothrix ecbatanensis]